MQARCPHPLIHWITASWANPTGRWCFKSSLRLLICNHKSSLLSTLPWLVLNWMHPKRWTPQVQLATTVRFYFQTLLAPCQCSYVCSGIPNANAWKGVACVEEFNHNYREEGCSPGNGLLGLCTFLLEGAQALCSANVKGIKTYFPHYLAIHSRLEICWNNLLDPRWSHSCPGCYINKLKPMCP